MDPKAQPATASGPHTIGARRTCLLAAAGAMAALASLTGCASTPSPAWPASVQMPLRQGWFEGEIVFYVTTDVSDAKVAADQGAHFVPRLAHALPQGESRPGRPSPVDKVYAVTNYKQSSVFASAPLPMGATNRDSAYSPLWRMVEVTWTAGHTPQPLTSQEQILAAEERGAVRLQLTDVVLNCPIVHRAMHGGLPGVAIQGTP